jgi:hypothetical protein
LNLHPWRVLKSFDDAAIELAIISQNMDDRSWRRFFFPPLVFDAQSLSWSESLVQRNFAKGPASRGQQLCFGVVFENLKAARGCTR